MVSAAFILQSFGANLPPQSLPVKYLKIRSIFFCSSQNLSAMTVNGNDTSTFVGRLCD
jgi:hypothetical protein